jgi:hypothetical protein
MIFFGLIDEICFHFRKMIEKKRKILNKTPYCGQKNKILVQTANA